MNQCFSFEGDAVGPTGTPVAIASHCCGPRGAEKQKTDFNPFKAFQSRYCLELLQGPGPLKTPQLESRGLKSR